MTRLRESDRAEIVRLTQEGLPVSDIAERIGCCDRTVSRVRRAAGIATAVGGGPWTPERFELAERLFDDGASQAEVARTLGTNTATVRGHFPGRGWTKSDGARFGVLVRSLMVGES